MGRDKIKEADAFLTLQILMNIGYDADACKGFLGNLVVDIKTADRIHFIAKEINAVRIFIRKGINIDNTTANGKLARFIHEVYTFKPIFKEHFVNEFKGQLIAFRYLEGIGSKSFTGNYFLNQGVGISNHNKRFPIF